MEIQTVSEDLLDLDDRVGGTEERVQHSEGFLRVNINHILDKKIHESRPKKHKEFRCIYCQKTFLKNSALGGHISKNHPDMSNNFKRRQQSLRNLKIERERKNYFKKFK